MSTNDERVERVARALYAHDEHANWDDVANDAASGDRLAGATYEYYIAQARAVIAALDEEAPLEGVLDGICRQLPGRYVGYTIRRRFVLGEWGPYMVFARWTDDDGESLWEQEGTGATIDAAIRDAVQQAKAGEAGGA